MHLTWRLAAYVTAVLYVRRYYHLEECFTMRNSVHIRGCLSKAVQRKSGDVVHSNQPGCNFHVKLESGFRMGDWSTIPLCQFR